MSGRVAPIPTNFETVIASFSQCHYTISSSSAGCCCLCYNKESYKQSCELTLAHIARCIRPDDSLWFQTYKVRIEISQLTLDSVTLVGDQVTLNPNPKYVTVYKSGDLRVSAAWVIINQYLKTGAVPEKPSGCLRFKRKFCLC